jgi:hypothetical protein
MRSKVRECIHTVGESSRSKKRKVDGCENNVDKRVTGINKSNCTAVAVDKNVASEGVASVWNVEKVEHEVNVDKSIGIVSSNGEVSSIGTQVVGQIHSCGVGRCEHWPMSEAMEDELVAKATKNGKVDHVKLSALHLEYAQKYSLVPWGNFENWKLTRLEKELMLARGCDLVRAGFATVYRPRAAVTGWIDLPIFICRVCGKNPGSHFDAFYHEESHGIGRDLIAEFRKIRNIYYIGFKYSFDKWKVSRPRIRYGMSGRRKRRPRVNNN